MFTRLDDGSTVTDLQGNDWTRTNGSKMTGRRGYDLSGTTDRIQSPDLGAVMPTDKVTIVVMLEPLFDQATNSFLWAFGNQSGASARDGIMLYNEGSTCGWTFAVNQYAGSGGNAARVRTGPSVKVFGPSVFVGIYDKAEERIELYVNGIRATQPSVSGWADINNLDPNYTVGSIPTITYSMPANFYYVGVFNAAWTRLQALDITSKLLRAVNHDQE
jgi:hypothetical protein